MKSLYKAFAKGLSRTNTPPPANIYKANNKIPDGFKTLGKTALVAMVFMSIINSSQAQNGQKYSTGGNQLSNGDVLGSTNNQPLIFISNGAEAFRIKPNGSAVFKNDIKLKGGLQITDFEGTGFRLLKVNDDGTLSVLMATNNQSDVLTGAGIFTPFASMFQKQWDERFNGSSDNLLAQDGHFYPLSSLSQNSWNLKGNEGVNPNEFFIGNKDARDLSIRTNNHERLRVLSTGEVQISAPDNANTFAFDVAGNAHIGGWLYVDNGVVISERIEGDEIKTRELELLANSIIKGKASFEGEMETQERVVIGDKLFNTDPKYRLSINGATEVKGDLSTGNIYAGELNTSGNIVAQGDITTGGKLIVNKLISQNEIEFGGGQVISYYAPTSNEGPIYNFGRESGPNATADYCKFGILNQIPKNRFAGNIEVRSWQLDEALRILRMGFDGANGMIEMEGAKNPDGTTPSLHINYYCGRPTVIGSAENGGDLIAANNVTVRKNEIIDGKLGIGIQSPTEKLEVAGIGKFFNYDYANNTNKFVSIMHDVAHGRIESTEDLYINYDKNTNVKIGQKATGGASLNVTKNLDVDGISNLNGDVNVGQNLKVLENTTTKDLSVTSTGFVNDLTVSNFVYNKSGQDGQFLMNSDGMGNAQWASIAQSQWEDNPNLSNSILYNKSNNNGKVGINTTKPLGAFSINNTDGKDKGITISNWNVTTSFYNLTFDGSNAGAIQVNKLYPSVASDQPSFGNSAYNLFLQPEGGDVRIGKYDEVSGNESNLFVDGKIESKDLKVNNLAEMKDATISGNLKISVNSSGTSQVLMNDGSGNAIWGTPSENQWSLKTNGIQNIENRNIGIGIEPILDSKLIISDGYSGNWMQIKGNGPGDIVSSGSFSPHFATGATFKIHEGTPPDAPLRFKIENKNTFLSPEGGRVVVGELGSNTPEGNLYVVDNGTNAGIILAHKNNSLSFSSEINNNHIGSKGPLLINYYTGNNIVFGDPGKPRSDVKLANGNLGIGLDPTYALDIKPDYDGRIISMKDKYGYEQFAVNSNGFVYAREINIFPNNTNYPSFPDYVFNKDYNLMPLEEVENYVNKNKHLPNIPDACTVEEKGINMSELQIKQMEKIEELYLYVISLQKENKELKLRVSHLENK